MRCRLRGQSVDQRLPIPGCFGAMRMFSSTRNVSLLPMSLARSRFLRSTRFLFE